MRCFNGACQVSGMSATRPSAASDGARANESAMMPPSAEPEVANWAVCEMFSPNTSLGWIVSHKPARCSASLARALVSFPLMTAQVVTLIHWQALRLWLKRTPFYTHPDKLFRGTLPP